MQRILARLFIVLILELFPLSIVCDERGIISDLGTLALMSKPNSCAPIVLVDDSNASSIGNFRQWRIPRQNVGIVVSSFDARFFDPGDGKEYACTISLHASTTIAFSAGNNLLLTEGGDVTLIKLSSPEELTTQWSSLYRPTYHQKKTVPSPSQNPRVDDDSDASNEAANVDGVGVVDEARSSAGNVVLPAVESASCYVKPLKIIGISTTAAVITAVAIKLYNDKNPNKKKTIARYAAGTWVLTALMATSWYYWVGH